MITANQLFFISSFASSTSARVTFSVAGTIISGSESFLFFLLVFCSFSTSFRHVEKKFHILSQNKNKTSVKHSCRTLLRRVLPHAQEHVEPKLEVTALLPLNETDQTFKYSKAMAFSFEATIVSRGYHLYKETFWVNTKVGDEVEIQLETNHKSISADPYACAIKEKHEYFLLDGRPSGIFHVKFHATYTFLSNKKEEKLRGD